MTLNQNLVDLLHFPEYTTMATDTLDLHSAEIIDAYASVLIRRYDLPEERYVLDLFLPGRDFPTTAVVGPMKLIVEFIYQASKRFPGLLDDTREHVTKVYGECPKHTADFLTNCILPIEWRDAEVAWLSERVTVVSMSESDLARIGRSHDVLTAEEALNCLTDEWNRHDDDAGWNGGDAVDFVGGLLRDAGRI